MFSPLEVSDESESGGWEYGDEEEDAPPSPPEQSKDDQAPGAGEDANDSANEEDNWPSLPDDEAETGTENEGGWETGDQESTGFESTNDDDREDGKMDDGPLPDSDIDLEMISAYTQSTFLWNTESVTFAARIANNGADNSESFKIAWYLSPTSDPADATGWGSKLCELSVPSLHSGDEQVFKKDCSLLSSYDGNYHVIGYVDSNNDIGESDESNNVFAARTQIEVRGQYIDLKATGLTVTQNKIEPGDSIDYQVKVVNAGTLPSGLWDFYLEFKPTVARVPTLYCTHRGASSLDGGEVFERTGRCTLDETVAPAEYLLTLEVDPEAKIGEHQEDNNDFSTGHKLEVAKPETSDLQALSANASDYETTPGSTISFSFMAKNAGNQKIDKFGYSLYYSVDTNINGSDFFICNKTDLTGLAAGSSRSIKVDCDVPDIEGDYYFGVLLDPEKAIEESNEDNNTKYDSKKVSIKKSTLDLELLEASTNLRSALESTLVPVESTVKNTGSETIASYTVDILLSSDTTITDADTFMCGLASKSSIAAGASQTLSGSCLMPKLTDGDYYLGAIVDPDDKIDEDDENNNTAYQLRTLTKVNVPDSGKVDLAATAVSIDKNPVHSSDNVQLNATIENTGNSYVSGFVVAFYLSADKTITTSDYKLGESFKNSGYNPGVIVDSGLILSKLPGSVSAGTYYLGALVDPANVHSETNENNNVAIQAAQVVVNP